MNPVVPEQSPEPPPLPAIALLPDRATVDVTPTAPIGWWVKHSWTVVAPDGQANVIASSEPLSDRLTTEQYAEIQGDLLRKDFPGYRESAYVSTRLDGRVVMRRTFEWTPPDGVRVTQMQIYCVVSGRLGARGVTATATTPTSNFPRVRATFAAVLAALWIQPAADGDPSLTPFPVN